MAEQLRENLGDDFLMECWADDPASADCDQKTISEVSTVGDCVCGWGAGEVG